MIRLKMKFMSVSEFSPLEEASSSIQNTIYNNVQSKVPIENVLAMYKAVQDYGRYSIQ